MTSNVAESTGSYSATTVVTAAVLAAIAAAVAILLAQAFGFIAAGDEAPIRVKNLSIDLEVVHNAKHWKDDGDNTKWKMSSGTRSSEDYELYVVPSDVASCPGGLKRVGKTVRFTHSDDTWIELKATGRKTKVTASKGLTRSGDKKTLIYAPSTDSGYIKSIAVDGAAVCTFTAKDAGLSVLMVDL